MSSKNNGTLPQRGESWDDLKAKLEAMRRDDHDWKRGRVPALTYFLDEPTLEVQGAAYKLFSGEPVGFKSSAVMLDDIFSMALPLFHSPQGAGATFTTGGTESVFLAIKTAKMQARALRSKPTAQFNIVAPVTAHPCLNKAAEVMDIEVRRVAIDNQYRGDVAALEAAIDENTIMIYVSAPCYPYGVFDPIAAIGELAQRREIWLHIDACWGGFLSPFAQKLGYSIPDWDFQVPGVTSISADLHKFGYAAKGASLVVYRDAAVQQYERFEFSDWPRGTYTSPSFLGTKPAGAIASAWAVMRFLGEEGYLRATGETMQAVTALMRGINEIPGLKCLEPNGESAIMVYVSNDPEVDIMAVADRLQERGWFRGRMRSPLGIHQGVNPAHLPVVDDYLREVRDATEFVRTNRVRGEFDEHTYELKR